ncbi:hypothetical protein K474DRAFT_816584 [Panus rudis PR-1116 ss-1]|nr:hypothetical protein K474DRAFT_816584 [Panus rudis PR-1116 ss-1]
MEPGIDDCGGVMAGSDVVGGAMAGGSYGRCMYDASDIPRGRAAAEGAPDEGPPGPPSSCAERGPSGPVGRALPPPAPSLSLSTRAFAPPGRF